MRTFSKVIKTKPVNILIIVLIAQFIAGCLSPTLDTPTPAPQFDAVGTAQAQVSDLEFSPQPQEILPDVESWIQGHSYEIESLGSSDYSDLQFLEPLLEGKRIVQLGEDDHETSEQSLMKARLIKYLHQELGYEVIAFESSLLDNYVTNCLIPELTPIKAMDRIFLDIWHTEEVLPLFEYMKENSSSSSPLILAGFDNYSFGEGFDDISGFYYSLLEDFDSDYASEIGSLEELWIFPEGAESVKNIIEEIGYQNAVQAYNDLANYIEINQKALEETGQYTPELIEVAKQAAWSRAQHIEAIYYRSNKQNGDYMKVRDKSMAINVQFLAEELYPDKKIIIWAHNGHIAEKSWWQGENIDNMGTYLNEHFGEELFTIGLIGPRSTDGYWSLVNQLHLYGKSYLFVDLSLLDENTVNSTIPTQIKNASEEFDALIFMDKITSHHVID